MPKPELDDADAVGVPDLAARRDFAVGRRRALHDAHARHLRRTLPPDPGTWRRIDCYRARICLGELAWGSEATLGWVITTATAIITGSS